MPSDNAQPGSPLPATAAPAKAKDLSPRPLSPCQGWQVFSTPAGPVGLAWTAAGELAGASLPAQGDLHRSDPAPAAPGMHAAHPGSAAQMARRFGQHTQAAPAAVPTWVQAWAARLCAVQSGHSPDRLLDIPLADAAAPPFHRRVWAQARQLAPGQTCSYGELAHALGVPGAARAVGQALGANPFAPIVPCHRVLAARGASGGFSAPGGTSSKLRLLALEGARFEWLPGQASLF